MIAVYLANGFEEIEALATVDILRRAQLETLLISIEETKEVTGSHGIRVGCDALITDIKPDEIDLIVLPGGMPGAQRLDDNALLHEHIDFLRKKNKPLAAICAAPMILGKKGLLANHEATAFPGFEKYLTNARLSEKKHLWSNGICTARGAGMAMDFAFDLVEYFKGKEYADMLAEKMIFSRTDG